MITNNGRDWKAGVLGDTASTGTGAYAAANYIAVTADATTPSDTDTALPGEVGSGTLVRVQATYAHTSGSDTYTLSNVFTSDQTITLNKIGVFNASTSGTLVFETLLNEPASLYSGDQVLIEETVTI
jgi:hypothetical protein